MAQRAEAEVKEADQIFLLMKEEYRISRNVRLAWFLRKLNQIIWPVSTPELLHSENELDLLSILPKGWQPEPSDSAQPYVLVPSTRASFLARRYRFVIQLDLSPSTRIVDDGTGEMIFDEVFHALSRCLAGLVQPFKVPGTEQLFRPNIFITILAYSSIIGLSSHQVLVQGCQLERTDLDVFLKNIYQQLRALENSIAEVLHQQYLQAEAAALGPEETEEAWSWSSQSAVSMVSADMGLVSMIRQGILALQLLPPNSSAGIILITDGVSSVPDVAMCETLLNQLRSSTITCSFVQVGGSYSYDCSFGYIPNVELMKFMSLATFGSYLPSCPEVHPGSEDMNVYHRAFLTYSFLKSPESTNAEYFSVSQDKLFNEHLVSASGNPALVMRRKKHTEKEVQAHLVSVVSVRLREGYTIRDVSLSKGGSQLEVKLVLLWKHNMHIEYVASAPWPLDPAKRSTRVEVTMEGSYDILHDISCTQRKPITSPYRTCVIRRFWNTLQSINQTDQMLVHLQSFNSIPENYTIPESTKNGVPLFYIPPGSTTPVLSQQHSGSKDSSQSQFAAYWKPILSMDANFWQRWLHMHRIAIILEHDMPVPKHLHTAGSNGRYSTIQCRISHSALTSLLRDCSSFVLVEGYSYVKLIYSSPDQPPSSFYLVRLISKAPCMVLRLGFPIGTPAHIRNKIVDKLKEQILKLRFPHRVQSKEATPKTKRKAVVHQSPSKGPSSVALQPSLSDRPCVVVLNKPLEKLLIRYEKLPLDFRTPYVFSTENCPNPCGGAAPLSVAANRTASSTLASLTRYFLHRRWVWAVQGTQGPTVPIQAVAHILSMLSEIRVSEGFHFAASGEGIVNMVIELPMSFSSDMDTESPSCIVQYIMFPPHSTATKDSFSTDDDNDTELEALDVDSDLTLVTECWVEPQSGSVLPPSEQLRHLQGLQYHQIPQAIFPGDLACMSTMMTFEHLNQLCHNKEQVCSLPPTVQEVTGDHTSFDDSIHMVPFQFDLMQLLPRCQQVELFFLTFSTALQRSEPQPCVPNELLLSLFHTSLSQELSDREVPLCEPDHAALIQHILQRERHGHTPPFCQPPSTEERVQARGKQDTDNLHTSGASKEVMGSTSTLQSLSTTELVEEELLLPASYSSPQWRCYAKSISSQHILLTLVPATFTDVQMLMASELESDSSTGSGQDEDTLTASVRSHVNFHTDSLSASLDRSECGPLTASAERSEGRPLTSCVSSSLDGLTTACSPSDPWVSGDQPVSENESVNSSSDVDKEGVLITEFPASASAPQLGAAQLGAAQLGAAQLGAAQLGAAQLRCPVYVYSCALEQLREQLVQPSSSRRPNDVFLRSVSQDRSSPSPWPELLSQPHKHKELAHYCSLLQEHYHQSYVKGVYRSLQQSYSISAQDVLLAMDYCEESLQEMDISAFLHTLCGHVRRFREQPWVRAAFTIGDMEEHCATGSVDFDANSESECTSPQAEGETRSDPFPEFPLSLLQSQSKCESQSPELHRIIQDQFSEILSQYFKPVPSSPHYFFYCLPSNKEQDSDDETERRPVEDMVSEAEPATEDEAVCMQTESDSDLLVEYEDQPGPSAQALGSSVSDSNTVNQDDDSFSILEGGSVEGLQLDMPPLFVHITCSVNVKSSHGSVPVQTLPTCLGQVISCLENVELLHSVDLKELSVTLDIFILTLPLEIEVLADFHHNRYTSESSVSLNRSPGQPSSYRSDDELLVGLDALRAGSMDGVSGDPLSKLPDPHRSAIVATMDEIRWLLEDEMVSALRSCRLISSDTLLKVVEHVSRSAGRPHCHCEEVPLQFVFGPEQSLEKFKQEFRHVSLARYVFNAEEDFFYISLSRLHPQRIHGTNMFPLSTGPHNPSGPCPDVPRGPAEADSNLGPSTDLQSLPYTTSGVEPVSYRTELAVSYSPPKAPSSGSLADCTGPSSHSGERPRPSRVQSVVSSQGSLDSDMQGYDGGSSDSECESPTLGERDTQPPMMPDFWLILQVHQDRVKVYSHSRNLRAEVQSSCEEMPEYLQLHQAVVSKIGEICRVVNQRMLLQDLHDSHVCNSLLVAESEEDIWKNEAVYRQRTQTSDDYSTEESYQARDYLAATMQFIPGHFACDIVWRTIIHIHPRLKMGPNMGVSRAIQALRSVLSSFCVVNRKNMFVYQERTTKSVFYLRLCETSLENQLPSQRSVALARSQEPSFSDDPMASRSPLEASRPVGQVDKHILLLVHGVESAGPEITDELVKVLQKRLDETTLDIITVMLVRNCKLTPADVEFIQPLDAAPSEVMVFSLPLHCSAWLPAVAHYLRQNLLIFLHVPKYTDNNTAHHFKHCSTVSSDGADGDIYLYNKPGGQGTGGKGIACITLSFLNGEGGAVPIQVQRTESSFLTLDTEHYEELTMVLKVPSGFNSSGEANAKDTEPQLYVRFNIWEQGNISPLQLSDKLQGALRHALCDVVMELQMLPNLLCVEVSYQQAKASREEAKDPASSMLDVKDKQRSGSRLLKGSPAPIVFSQGTGATPLSPESTTPTSKSTRRSFWDILSKPDSTDLVSPKTTDDIVQERGEEGRATRRRHKTETVKQQWGQERGGLMELEQQRRHLAQLEEGDVGALHPVYQHACESWIMFMTQLGCPSIQQCMAELASHFLLPSLLTEIISLVSSLASDTVVKAFQKTSCPSSGELFLPLAVGQNLMPSLNSSRSFILIGRNFHQWHNSTQQVNKGLQHFEALEHSEGAVPEKSGTDAAPRQRFLFITITQKKVALYSYNWSVDLGCTLNRELLRLVHWQNARAHVVHCLLSQKMGLFHHYCFSDMPVHQPDSKQEPNPFLSPSMEPDALLRSAMPPVSSKDQGRLVGMGRILAPLHFPSELLPFDEALRDVCSIPGLSEGDAVSRHGGQLLDIKAGERRELEKQMKIENLFVTWQQRSAQSNMPISAADLEILKQSSRLVHYCATPLLFDPLFRKNIQEEQVIHSPVKRHRSNDSSASGRDRSYSTDSGDMLPIRLRDEPWLQDVSCSFLQHYVQYLQSMGFILVQVRPQSPARSIARSRAAMLSSTSSEGRMSFSYVKQKSEDSPKTSPSATTHYHLQRALPGGIVLMELAFQGCYFCVKQYALECSRIPMGQSVNSQGNLLTKPRTRPYPDASPVSDCALSMLFTEECDKVRDLMHVHSFSYDFHLRLCHQYLQGSHMTLRQGYQLTDFLDDFIFHHPDIPKFGHNHVFQGSFSMSTGIIPAHQLYNYITDHAGTYGMKPLRMSRAATSSDSKKAPPELHEYALVALWTSSGSYKDLEGLHHHDDFDVSLVVCHNAVPFEEQSDTERHLLRLRFYVLMTSQRELFPRLTADMRRFKKLPQIHKEPEPEQAPHSDRAEGPQDSWEQAVSEALSDGNEFYPLAGGTELLPLPPLFPLLQNEVSTAQRQMIQSTVEQAMEHCRRDNLWRRLFHGEHVTLDKLKLTKLSFSELEELLEAVQSCSVGDIDPQLECFLSMSPAWYQSLIKVLLSRFPQSCRHFDDNGVQYLAVLNQKFTDCFVLVFLNPQAGKTSLKVVFREPLPAQPSSGGSPPPQLVHMYHHLESIINTACYNLWSGLL
ncbi:KICSTOR complex protein SZT2 isoform X3 [Boleophthalmus pectinirostris]|uniref:KICSTOR complex protein SZT2 isoform X3 n=1 Tax=Boleophthalmus pectinirostris TaxID=150288 RepID=UPI00242B82CF|nr:KICSTOR complex protein SZT2 isoform X3 [Boleophthalmus pectinirostris]